jgi:hypothetical protein
MNPTSDNPQNNTSAKEKCIHLNPRQPAEINFAKNWI